MEQLRLKADQFRKQGRVQDQDLEEIISKIKTDEEFKEGEEKTMLHQRVCVSGLRFQSGVL
jgi:hypothetical protein